MRVARDRVRPVLEGANIKYEMANRSRGISTGGLPALHALVQGAELPQAINRAIPLLKRNIPYHESDHVLNIAYNVLAGGRSLDDIELLRHDEAFMDALGADRIPDPTTAGDFTRRFEERHVVALMDAINGVRPLFWKLGLDEVDRSGNRPSHEGFASWADKAVALVRGTFQRVLLRGDTDFSLTREFDRWTRDGVFFIFGYDAKPNVVEMAGGLDPSAWERLRRRDEHPRVGDPRARPGNVKEAIVIEKGFRNLRLEEEHVAEFPYTPVRFCERPYRMVVVRKRIVVRQGQTALFNEERYLFYITNRLDLRPEEVVFLANDRCNQENLIAQLKGGMNALRAPVGSLIANWAYMVMAALAWTIKAWFALMCREKSRRRTLLAMEFRGFLQRFVCIPVQVVRTGRQVVLRILGYSEWLTTFLSTFDRIGRLGTT